MKNLYILSTLNTNIGDEFIRDGVLGLLQESFQRSEYNVRVFNKHNPWTFYPKWHPIGLAKFFKNIDTRGWRKISSVLGGTKGNQFFDADLVIQSGTPILWQGVSKSEWSTAFWKSFAAHPNRKAPLWNLGGGSCYSWIDPPEKLTGKDREFAATMVDSSTLLTVRDPLAGALLEEVSGRKIPVIPCPAFLAGYFHVPEPKPTSNILLVNVMPKAGHFEYSKNICQDAWKRCIDHLVGKFQNDLRIRFVCHSNVELQYAKENWPGLEAFQPLEPASYFEECQGAVAAVTNRLHAAVGLSGLGIPSLAIGTDSRMLMTKEIGIPTFFAPDVTPDLLTQELHHLLLNRNERSHKLRERQQHVMKLYNDLLLPQI